MLPANRNGGDRRRSCLRLEHPKFTLCVYEVCSTVATPFSFLAQRQSASPGHPALFDERAPHLRR
jgi:hypothetical protein